MSYLVLSRQCYEECVITVAPSTEPTTITMKVTEIRGMKVRTGWEAPQHVRIHRKEVDAKIRRHEREQQEPGIHE